MVGNTDASSKLRNLLVAWLSDFCLDPDEPLHLTLRLGMFARLGIYTFLTGTVHLQELPRQWQQRAFPCFSVLGQECLLPVPVTCCKFEKQLSGKMLNLIQSAVNYVWESACLGRYELAISANLSITHFPLRMADCTHEIPSNNGFLHWAFRLQDKQSVLERRGKAEHSRVAQEGSSPGCFQWILEKCKENWQAQRGRICYSHSESLAGNIKCEWKETTKIQTLLKCPDQEEEVVVKGTGLLLVGPVWEERWSYLLLREGLWGRIRSSVLMCFSIFLQISVNWVLSLEKK